MNTFYAGLFRFLAALGRPFGGFRPHRVMHGLAHRAFPSPGELQPIKTLWGGVILGHPFYFLDRAVIIDGCYDRPLHRFLQCYIKPGMIVLDVGANIGEAALHMGHLTGPNGRVFAFEPAPPLLQRLTENVRLNGLENFIEIAPLALSDSAGTTTFAIADSDKENQGMGSLVNQANAVVTRQVEVVTESLDQFVKAAGIDRIDLIKVDIQGGELGFLAGGMDTLARFSPDMVMEISESDLACLGKQPADLVCRLEELGYRLFEFDELGVSEREVTSQNIIGRSISLNVFCTRS